MRALRHHSAFWRRLAYLGARHGPGFWLRYSPPVFGAVFAAALPTARAQVRETLRWIRGPVATWQERREVLDTFVNYACCLAESLAGERPAARAARVAVEGDAVLRDALGKGRGVVLVTAHVGPWDVAARLLCARVAADVVIAMRPEADAAARALHDAVRERTGVRVLHVGEHPLDALPLLRHLKAGGIVAVQLDRGAPSARVLDVDLFERRSSLPEGPFRLAALARAPVVPVFARRAGHFDYALSIAEPIELGSGAGEAELGRAAQRAADAMGRFIRQNPTQWFRFADPPQAALGARAPEPPPR